MNLKEAIKIYNELYNKEEIKKILWSTAYSMWKNAKLQT